MKKIPKVGQWAVIDDIYSPGEGTYKVEEILTKGDVYYERINKVTCEEVTLKLKCCYIPLQYVKKVCDTELQCKIWITKRELKQANNNVAYLKDVLKELENKS